MKCMGRIHQLTERRRRRETRMGRAQCVKDFVGSAAPERVPSLGKTAMKKVK